MEKRELHSVLTDFLNENLIQATASGQAEKNDFLKARIRPVLAKGVLHFQAEEFIGKQAFHKNLTAEEAAAYLEGLMETSFRQLQLEARDKSSSVLVSKKGKVTVKVKKSRFPGIPPEMGHQLPERMVPTLPTRLFRLPGRTDFPITGRSATSSKRGSRSRSSWSSVSRRRTGRSSTRSTTNSARSTVSSNLSRTCSRSLIRIKRRGSSISAVESLI